MRGAHALVDVAAAGREIGRDLAPEAGAADARTAMRDALSALGFAPRDESPGAHRFRYVLTNCPYRDAAAENAAWSARCAGESPRGCSTASTRRAT